MTEVFIAIIQGMPKTWKRVGINSKCFFMKKTSTLIVMAFLFAASAAFVPKAVKVVAQKGLTVQAYHLSTCATITCPDSGTTQCGYRNAGCSTQSFYNKP